MKTPKKRFFKLTGMTASVTTKFAKTKLKAKLSANDNTEDDYAKLYSEVGQQVVETLGELKGAAMKVGQAISQMKHLLPEEFTEALSQLQNAAPPMAFSVIDKQIKAELGFNAAQLFKHIDEVPFASASIGQVHRATTWDGEDVVVKIQYPGVDTSVKSDMSHLRRLLRLGGLLKVDKSVLEAVFDEIYQHIVEELDYKKEAKNAKRFAEFHADNDNIIIPKVLTQFSTDRILTMQYIEGLSFAEFVDTAKHQQDVINQAGKTLFGFVARQIYELQAIHSDPHPGNFAFTPDAKLIAYDFGCVTELEDDLVNHYRVLVKAAMDYDYTTLDSTLIALGVRDSHYKAPDNDFYKTWLDIILPALAGEEPFDFGKNHLDSAMLKQKELAFAHWRHFQPSPDTVFINRVLVGQYYNLVELGACVAFKPLLDEALAE